MNDVGVLRVAEIDLGQLEVFFKAQQLVLCPVEPGVDIPGSHWGECEAGLIKSCLYFRPDTPLHSMLHEGCHFLLMDDERRRNLHTDAGGTSVEENAVCYLQILLATQLPEAGALRMMQDMDSWGYSFRLGSTQAWFEGDAEDAVAFLKRSGVWARLKLEPLLGAVRAETSSHARPSAIID